MITTSRLALQQPETTDPVSALRTAIAANAAILARAAVADQGVLASRPTSTPEFPGLFARLYRVASGPRAGQVDFDHGSGWLEDVFPARPQRILVGAPGAPAFLASWRNYGGVFQEAGYTRDSDGFVHLFGTVVATYAPPIEIFQLPPGYRPDRRLVFPAGVGGRVDVMSSSAAGQAGFVFHIAGPAGQATLIASALSLDGMSFLAVA